VPDRSSGKGRLKRSYGIRNGEGKMMISEARREVEQGLTALERNF
jgi:hypothetical protein